MLLNDDLRIRTLVHGGRLDWVASPAQGVERRMLFRVGGERARATSIVRYAPGSRFAPHDHPGGEEFLVLEGTFQDETGDFPAGAYVRNPPGSRHQPRSDAGCVILVKLGQFKSDDSARIVRQPGEGPVEPGRPGVESSSVLYDGAGERVTLQAWRAGARIELTSPDGLELFVVAGEIQAREAPLTRWSWLRLPTAEPLIACVGPAGARVWVKSGPLAHSDLCDIAAHGAAASR